MNEAAKGDQKRVDKRSRASAACENCRSRRTKCIVPENATSCNYCRENNLTCAFRHDDERKRPISRAYVSSLIDRIDLLERTLRDFGHDVPPAFTYPPRHSDHDAVGKPFQRDDRDFPRRIANTEDMGSKKQEAVTESLPSHETEDFDEITPAIYLGDAGSPSNVLQQFPPDVRSYVRKSFDTYYNVLGHLDIDRLLEMPAENPNERSELLALCIFAMGFKFADHDHPVLQYDAILQEKKTALHEEAKAMFERNCGIYKNLTMVRAAIMISDLEVAAGKLDSGWRYSKLAYSRECFWMVFRNRPIGFDSARIIDVHLAEQLALLGKSNRPLNDQQGKGNFIERWQELLSLATEIMHSLYSGKSETPSFHLITKLDRRLHTWYTGLPDAFRLFTNETKTHAPKYFFMHKQYHAALILLHWQSASYNFGNLDGTGQFANNAAHCQLSRKTCTKNAVRVMKILKSQQEHTGSRVPHFTTLQYAAVSAIALVAGVEFAFDTREQSSLLEDLRCVTDVLAEISQTYEPAKNMSNTLAAMIAESDVNLKRLIASDSCFQTNLLLSSPPKPGDSSILDDPLNNPIGHQIGDDFLTALDQMGTDTTLGPYSSYIQATE
ncbi:hypothetical protein NA57DRAFT_61088 [Rhizodiscina lignyota]|uniref:Zn(2)-C6 fungal-type domain-containing protein n=1 Tax=Rhizodiscina lignyota TaxID=1504668 RepID=A0A9P4I6Z1_9PEZI|nr:hypothetical protein NA57DRAFT_61088 [Rhizodiscina lignyota]